MILTQYYRYVCQLTTKPDFDLNTPLSAASPKMRKVRTIPFRSLSICIVRIRTYVCGYTFYIYLAYGNRFEAEIIFAVMWLSIQISLIAAMSYCLFCYLQLQATSFVNIKERN